MRTLPLIAVASALWALPTFAEDGGNAIPSKPAFTLAQFDVCSGFACRYYDSRCLHVDDWHYFQGGVCRDVTIRDLCGDVVWHVRRCD